MTLHVAYDDRLLAWNLGKNHPTNPIRAKNAIAMLKDTGITMKVHPIWEPELRLLTDIHDHEYVQRTLAGYNSEWKGCRPDLGKTAALMFGGTVDLARMIRDGDAQVAFAPQGAKHHAMYDRGSGFCVFNDFAWAAQYLALNEERVLYLDYDAHAGDGVEALTRFNRKIMTASVHDSTIFPGTGKASYKRDHAYNFPLPAKAGDREMLAAVESILDLARDFEPTVLLIAIGADGHEQDPLSSLCYTSAGYRTAATVLGTFARERNLPVLMGGAGGYLPHDVTPHVWSTFVSALAEEVLGG